MRKKREPRETDRDWVSKAGAVHFVCLMAENKKRFWGSDRPEHRE